MPSFISKVITIGDYNYTQHPVTKDLSPIKGSSLRPAPPVTASENERLFALVRDGHKIFVVRILTGEVIRTYYAVDDITKAQLSDTHAQALVTDSVHFKATRAKRPIINQYGHELMSYRLDDGERFFMLLKAAVASDRTLRTDSGKLNFSFRDLGRILCMSEFTSEHLFSSQRGNEYTMAAYRKVVDKFAVICRQAWDGKALTLMHETDNAILFELAA